MKKTKKISIISAIIALVFVSGLLVLSHGQTLAYVSGGPGVQTAGGDREYDCNSGQSEFDSAADDNCGGGGGGTSGNPYQPPKEEPKKASFAEVTVFVQNSPSDIRPTGKITADRSSCVIEDGKNTCDAKFTWSVTNPDLEKVATVKRDPIAGPVINKNSGSEILPVYYWLDSEQNISKYSLIIDKVYKTTNPDGSVTTENGLILDSASVKATCKIGSSWVASLNQCVKDVSVKKFSTSNCIIPSGGSSCSSNINWEVVGGHGIFAVTTPNNINVGTGKSGSTTYSVQYPSRDFYLYNNGSEISSSRAYADCEGGTGWSVLEKKCIPITLIPPPGTGELSKFEAQNCVIKANESTCQTKLSWISTLLGSFAITTPENITISSNPTGTNVPYTVEYPFRRFFAYNNGSLKGEQMAYAKCEDGNIWSATENKCVSGMLCSGDLERDVYLDCPPGYDGKIILKQYKKYPECSFPEPVTEENSVLINNNCRAKEGDVDPRWIKTCGECSSGVEQVYCTEVCDTNPSTGRYCDGDLNKSGTRTTVINCPPEGGIIGGESVLNIKINASPEKIMKGRLSTITWSSNADSCKSITIPGYLNDFNTGNRPNGFDTVKPLSDTVYQIECTKGEKTESKTIEVKVGSVNIIER